MENNQLTKPQEPPLIPFDRYAWYQYNLKLSEWRIRQNPWAEFYYNLVWGPPPHRPLQFNETKDKFVNTYLK